MKLAKRLNHFETYLGTAMNLILTRMREEGKDVINLGLGGPDVVPPEAMRKALADACYDPSSHHYPSFYSPLPLKKAISGWYERQSGEGYSRIALTHPAERLAEAMDRLVRFLR